MENSWLKSKVTLFFGGLLLLVYAAITRENFSIGIVIVFLGPLLYRASLLLKKPNHGVLLNSLFLGIWVFLFFPGLLAIFSMAAIGLRMNNHYDPNSIRPRLLEERNLGPFAILSLLIVKFCLLVLDLDASYYSDSMDDFFLFLFILLMSIVGYAVSLFQNSISRYESLISDLAQQDRNWTNNVFTLLSHNIRTPIAALANRIEILKLKKEAQIEIDDEDIQSLNHDRARVNSIVQSLLSKSSRSIISQSNQRFTTINTLLTEYADRVTINKPEGVDFNISANARIALDLGLESVISNSEKYGSNNIKVYVREDSDDIYISVVDDGVGMDKQALERYGTPFNTTSSKEGGSGLGVYFALQLIKDAGWDWAVESEENLGTTVHVIIPKRTIVL
jgi:signal transduction histidine kinase